MKPTAQRVRCKRLLLGWYSRNARSLPWRTTRDPYRILLSEIMLQQTQVHRVLGAYPRFLKKFRSLPGLARAPRRDIIVAWQGLGYNKRAVRLHELARLVVRSHGGKLPDDEKTLLNLPGIGPYTAGALMAFAFARTVAAVDINAQRVLSRIFWRMRTTADLRSLREAQILADDLVPRGRAYKWNQALMDLGATVCTRRAPGCNVCPVAPVCSSRTSMRPATVRRPKAEPSLDGIPNRIYRGRVVQTLRGKRRPMALPVLGRSIHPSFSARHELWLQKIINGLRQDGLVRVRGNGSFRSRTVSLA